MKEVELKGGQVALVDDEDFPLVMSYRWQCRVDRTTSYAYTHIKRNGIQRNVRMHHLILGVVGNGTEVDHRDHNGLNNQKHNLRIATRSQNCANRRKINRATSSRFKGVYFDKSLQKWRARIKINGVRKLIGNFKDEVAAALAYNVAATDTFGQFAYLNQVESTPPNKR